jgi:DNA-binding MurR/RpiR family transcriptional regulator
LIRIGLPAYVMNRTGFSLAEQLIGLQRGDVLIMMGQKSPPTVPAARNVNHHLRLLAEARVHRLGQQDGRNTQALRFAQGGLLAEYTARLFSRIGLPAYVMNRTGFSLAEQLIGLQEPPPRGCRPATGPRKPVDGLPAQNQYWN